jgi:penicillin-binding protein 1A
MIKTRDPWVQARHLAAESRAKRGAEAVIRVIQRAGRGLVRAGKGLGNAAVNKAGWTIVGAAIAVAMITFSSVFGGMALPAVATPAQSSKVLAFDGQVIATLHGEENRTIVPLSKISVYLRHAVIAAEDRSFYQHSGISLRGIARAAYQDATNKRITQGGSTITQQYVRNAFPHVGKERTVIRKVRESLLALRLEKNLPKSKILEDYLNTVYFGRGAYGAEAAARTYFKVPATDLTLGQAAYLAGVIRSPERYSVASAPDQAVKLRNGVLGAMVQAGYLTAEQAKQGEAEDLVAQFKPGMSIEADSPRAGFFVEYVRRILRTEFKIPTEEILRGGLQIHTSLDLRMQDAAEAAISSVLNKPEDPEAALVAMDPQGYVRAMVGGRDVGSLDRARGFNFAANADGSDGGRPAGSAFKPFALAAFLDEGNSVNSTFSGPSTIRLDSSQCKNSDGKPWEVSNFDNQGFGSLDVVSATTHSVNTVYAQMMDEAVTPAKFIEMAGKAGIKIPSYDTGCALTLGTSDVTPLEMARAYTTFAQRGNRPEPIFVTKVARADGEVIAERSPRIEQTIDQNVADTVNYVLEKNVQGGTGTGAQIGRPAAGKTGTTQNFQNAWFAGYTPDLTAVVWMGYPPDPEGNIPLLLNVHGRRVTGGSFPASIWKKFMQESLKGTKKSQFAKAKLTGKVKQFGTSGSYNPFDTAPQVPSLDVPPVPQVPVPIVPGAPVPRPMPIPPIPAIPEVQPPRHPGNPGGSI